MSDAITRRENVRNVRPHAACDNDRAVRAQGRASAVRSGAIGMNAYGENNHVGLMALRRQSQ